MAEELQATPPAVRGGLAWLSEGARVLMLRAPRWDGLSAQPRTLALLVLAGLVLAFALQWALVAEPARLMWTGLLGGWVDVAVIAWLCWVVARSVPGGPSAATLMALLWSAACVLGAAQGLVELACAPAGAR